MLNCQQKVVTLEDLAQTLHAMHYAQVFPQSPLLELRIVHKFVPDFASSTLRDHLVMEWLAHLIVDQMNQHRRQIELAPASLLANQAQVICTIQEAFRRYSTLLQAWSILYARFAYAGSAFTMGDLADLTSHHERTLRRRQQLGYQRLLAHILYLNSQYCLEKEANEASDT